MVSSALSMSSSVPSSTTCMYSLLPPCYFKVTPGLETMNMGHSYPRQVCPFPSLQEVSVRDTTYRDSGLLPQLSCRSEQVLDHLLTISPLHLAPQPKLARIPQFPPALLFSICDVLRHDGSAECSSVSFLPLVLRKLRNWRLLDPVHRYTSAAFQNLALELARIVNEHGVSDCDLELSGPPHLRMKWAGSHSLGENSHPEPFQSAVRDETNSCSSALQASNEVCSGVVHVVSPRHHSVNEFRSGCSACRHPRVSFPATPHNPSIPHLARATSSRDVQFKEYTCSPVQQLRSAAQIGNEAKRAEPRRLTSISRRSEVDQNGSPLLNPAGAKPGIAFPRHCAHLPNMFPSRSSTTSASSTSSSAGSSRGILQPSHIGNRTRGNDNTTFNRRVVSVDHRLSAPRSTRLSLTNTRPPPRAQSFSHTHVTPPALGGPARLSIKGPIFPSTKLPERRLPSWSHPRTTTSITELAAPSPLCPVREWAPDPLIREANPPIQLRILDDGNYRSTGSSRRQTSYGFSSTSPLLQPRKWQP
ncbi:hypothetical protein PAXRUDRAFT_745593 [Paxillus rubicundulus Ve08.2h10]|uniref:Uncharacterized protein n=1 Tax=Paxillus rubicundulus Ve08.2h10 TaxID=930991 RepID=A0A0D0E7T3_9AGAM|nr:hypothetical protein PAXRUDRAFT_745593 [Paxillus rubicundulus Ve08.2h10]